MPETTEACKPKSEIGNKSETGTKGNEQTKGTLVCRISFSSFPIASNFGFRIFPLPPHVSRLTHHATPNFRRDRPPITCHSQPVTSSEAIALLEEFRAGQASTQKVLHAFQSAPIADLGFAKVDLHRALRKNFPEVIFGEGKTPQQVASIAAKIAQAERRVLITRITEAHARAVRRKLKHAVYHESARCLTSEKTPLAKRHGTIAVLAAGTSDLPVAEEAAVTADIMGNTIERLYDVGVAGLHRLLSRMEVIQSAHVIIAVAGMEGALPSVVAGLVNKPVIAVPTSVGYGANFGGLAALLGMLNSCGSGLTVVNINNGFGAGYAASQINALAAGELQ